MKRLAFWGGVAGVSVMADVLFNLAVDRFGDKVPGLMTLETYKNRRNG